MKSAVVSARLCGALVLALLAGLTIVSQEWNRSADGLRPVSSETSMFGDERPAVRVQRAHRPWELGLRFSTSRNGQVVALRYYRTAKDNTSHVGSVWSRSGDLLGRMLFPAATRRGWQRAALSTPVALEAGRKYVVSYSVGEGDYFGVRPQEFLRGPITRDGMTALTGVWAGIGDFPFLDGPRSNYLVDVAFVGGSDDDPTTEPTSHPTSTTSASPTPPTSSPTVSSSPTTPTSNPSTPTSSPTTPTSSPTTPTSSPTTPTPSPPTPTPSPPTPTPTPPSPGGFPDASNTGVPDGTTLSTYTGPCTIRTTVTLTAVNATNCGALLIRAANVTISKSMLPVVDLTGGGSSSATITDSTVRGGNWSDGSVWGFNFTLVRSEVTGGQHNVHCNDNCTVIDSWLHDQYNPNGQSYHNNAFISNGGSHMVLRHNTLHCTAILNSTNGGCTADVSLFGDFDPISDVLIENNFLRANNSSISYCAYGGYQPSKPHPIATQVRYINNVFERGTNNKCGVFGPVTSFQSGAAGNVWSGNVWDKGGTVNP